jgi:hypothetical protein
MSNTNPKGSAKPQQRIGKGRSKSEGTAGKTSRSKRHAAEQDITSGEHADNGDKMLVNGTSTPEIIIVHGNDSGLIFLPSKFRIKYIKAGSLILSGEDADKLGKLISFKL